MTTPIVDGSVFQKVVGILQIDGDDVSFTNPLPIQITDYTVLDARYLKLDQTIGQTVINGFPTFAGGLKLSSDASIYFRDNTGTGVNYINSSASGVLDIVAGAGSLGIISLNARDTYINSGSSLSLNSPSIVLKEGAYLFDSGAINYFQLEDNSSDLNATLSIIGNFNLISDTFNISSSIINVPDATVFNFNMANGTTPFTVDSTTLVSNLNADLWDGYQFADYLDQAVKTTSTPTFDATTITSTSDSGLTINYHSTHYLRLEPYTTSNHAATLKSADFIYMAGQSALSGYFGSSGFSYVDDKGAVFGSAGSAKANSIWGRTTQQRTSGSAPYIQTSILAVADTDYSAPNYIYGRYWLMCDAGDINYSFNHGKQNNPTLFIHSANQSTTEWIGFTHDQTNGVISTGAGDLDIILPANKTIELQTVVWKDINLGAAQVIVPSSSYPSIDEFKDSTGTDTGVETLAFAVDESISGQFEIQHDYKEGSDFTFHVHWQGIAAPTGTDYVQWRLNYTLSREGVVLAAMTQIDSGDDAFDTQYKFARSNFPAITGTNYKIGDQFIFKLTRIASTGDAYAGDALMATCGLHYQIDTIGSRQIGTK